MRVLSIFVLFLVTAAGQTVSGRQPAVAWKRQMAPNQGSSVLDAEPLGISIPVLKLLPASPVLPIPSAPRLTPPPSASTPQETRNAVAELRNGVARADVIAALGQPLYSIGMPDGVHYVERCRFRTGNNELATIELRDGRVTAILIM